MEILTEIWAYGKANWHGILIAGGAVISAAQFIVRLTPTEVDDGFVTRVGKRYDKLLDFFKVPNMRKKPGTLVTADGTHEKND